MGKSKTKLLSYLVIGVVVVFFAIDLVAGLVCPDIWAFDAAADACRRNGWQPGTWSSGQSNISGGLIGKTAAIVFIPNDQSQCKSIHITLRKPTNFLPWKLMAYAEEPSRP